MRARACTLVLALCGCAAGEVEDLERLQREAELRLAERRELAANLAQRQAEHDALLRTFAAIAAPPSPEEVRARVAGVLPRASIALGRDGVEVSGEGGASGALEALASSAPWASVVQARRDGPRWSLLLTAPRRCATPGPQGLTRVHLPVRRGFICMGADGLRERLRELEARIQAEERRIGEHSPLLGINGLRACVERTLTWVERDPTHVRPQRGLLDAFLGDEGPATGSLALRGRTARVEGDWPQTATLAHALGAAGWSPRPSSPGVVLLEWSDGR